MWQWWHVTMPLLKVVVTVTTTLSRAIWNFFTLFLCWKRPQKAASSAILQEITHRKPIKVSVASSHYTVYVVNVENLCTNFDAVLPKPFSFKGASPLWPPTRGSVLGPRWGICPDPRYRLALHALTIHVCPRPLSPPLFGVKLRRCLVGVAYDFPSCRYRTLHTNTWRHITCWQPEPIIVVAVCATNMRWATVIHYQVQTDTGTHIGSWANCCNTVFSCCCHMCSAMTRSNMLYIAVNHRLISCGKTCQIRYT